MTGCVEVAAMLEKGILPIVDGAGGAEWVAPPDVTVEIGGCCDGPFPPALLCPVFLHDVQGTVNDVLGG